VRRHEDVARLEPGQHRPQLLVGHRPVAGDLHAGGQPVLAPARDGKHDRAPVAVILDPVVDRRAPVALLRQVRADALLGILEQVLVGRRLAPDRDEVFDAIGRQRIPLEPQRDDRARIDVDDEPTSVRSSETMGR
jgi:hypothetical protein